MEKVGAFFTAIKDGYLVVADWVDAHPHKTIWIAAGVIAAGAIFMVL